MIAGVFREADIARLVRLDLYLAIVIVPLVVVQYSSPAEAWINRGTNDDAVATVVDGIVRPYGTFSYTTGHALWVTGLFTLLVIAWMQRRRYNTPHWLVFAGGGAILVMALTTGSRSIYFNMVLVGLELVGVTLMSPKTADRIHALLLPGLIVAATVGLYSSVLETSYQAMLKRQE